MKTFKKVWIVLLLAMILQGTAVSVLPAMQVQAAVKNGLVKKKNKFYFYKKGKPLKKKWKTVKVDGKKYKFYFGKNGAAYRARTLYQNAYNVKVYKIGSKKYGFDSNSHRVASGIYIDGTYRFLVFGKGGVYNASKTKKLRSAMKTYYETGKVSKGMYNKVVSLLGKPVSVLKSDSCNPWNDKDSFTDVVMKYKYFEVQLVQNNRTKEYSLDNYFPREDWEGKK